MKMLRKLVSIVAAATLLTSSLAFTASVQAAEVEVDSAVASEPNLQADPGDGVILHAFNWSYNAIKQNLPQIKAAGYSTVQTSPVTQPKNYGLSSDVANQWWKLYQPVSLSIAQSSWLGTKQELTDLCTEADKYGIKIIVDIVANHMANNVSASGTDLPNELGPEVQTYEPTLYNSYSTYFHSDQGTAGDGNLKNQVWGHVSACPDLNTGNSTVQSKILALLKECIDCGVDGFRFDAAKHIENDTDSTSEIGNNQFWNNTLDQAKTYYSQKNGGKQLFAYGEILNGLASGRSMNGYTKRMRITDNTAGNAVLQGVKNGSASSAAHFGYDLSGSGSKSVLWAESHDTFMGTTGGSTSGISDDKVVKAWAIVASRKDATALYFARPGSALMGEAAGDLTYKSTAVSEVNKFHNAFVGQSEKTGYSGNFVYVARGNSGIVITNVNGTTANVSISGTGLADGSYVDTVSGNTFTVSGGTVSGQMGSTGVAVVYHSTTTPKATASVESGSFSTATMTVQLGLENAVSGTYALEDSAPVSFTGTPTIRIGSDYNVGETITLNLTATDAAGQTATSTYFYTKKQPTTSGIYVFLKPSIANGWTNVSCYVYDEKTTNLAICYSNGGWPGQAMTYDSALGYYWIEIPAACVQTVAATGVTTESTFDLPHSPNTYVIFNGTKNNITTQYPAANAIEAQKLKLGGGTTNMVLESAKTGGWKSTTMKPNIAEVQATDVTKGDAVVTEPSTEPSTEPPATEPSTEETTEAVDETIFVQKGIYGDANLDGKLDIRDVTAIQRDVAEFNPRLSGLAKTLADVDQDGDITVKDASYIQIYLAEYSDNFAHTGEPYGEYEQPSGETFTVTAKSNLFAQSSKKFDKVTQTVTVTYFAKSDKDLLSTDWTLSYDKTALQLAGTNCMPCVDSYTHGTVDEGICGNFTDIRLAPLSQNGKQVGFVSATFTVLDPKNTEVNLTVKDLTVSKLNAGETTSKAENETDIVENSVVKEPDSAYTLTTSIYSGSYNGSYVNAADPQVVYNPGQQPTTDPIPSDSTDPTDAPGTRTIEFTDNKGWGQAYIYIYGPDGEQAAWPGVPMTMVLEDNGFGGTNYAYDIPTDCEFFICNDGQAEGGQQTVDIVDDGVSTGWYPLEETDELGHYLVGSWIDEDPVIPTGGEDPTHADEGTQRIQFTDNKGWGTAYIYIYGPDGAEPAGAWPGTPMNSIGSNPYGGTNYWYDLPTNCELFIFNNGLTEGADQTVDVTFAPNVTGWYPTEEKDDAGHWYVDTWYDPDGGEGGEGGQGGSRQIQFTDNQGWGTAYIYAYGDGELTGAWPGTAMTVVEQDNGYGGTNYGYTLPEGTEFFIFNNGLAEGADQTVDIFDDGVSVGWYPLQKNGEGKWEVGSWGGDDSGSGSGSGGSASGYYLVGYFDGADYWGTDHPFVNGQVTMNFAETSYAYIRDAAGNAFMANGYPGEDATSAILYSTDITGENSDKLIAPAGSVTFTLSANGDGTFTLSTDGSGGGQVNPPADTKYIEFTNNNDWADVYVYAYGGGELTGAWPGTIMENKGDNGYGKDNWGFNVPTNAEFIIFSNGYGDDNGGQQTVNIPFNAAYDGWYLNGSTDESNHYEVSHWPDDSQNPSDTKTVTFSSNKGWTNVYIHNWGGSSSTPWPGAQMTNIGVNDYGETQFTFDIPADTTGIVFHNNNGTQTVDINYDSSVTGYYLTTQSNGKWEVATWT